MQLRAEKDDHISRLQDQAAAREAQLLSEAEAVSTELIARIDNLQAELECVLDYKKNRVRALTLTKAAVLMQSCVSGQCAFQRMSRCVLQLLAVVECTLHKAAVILCLKCVSWLFNTCTSCTALQN